MLDKIITLEENELNIERKLSDDNSKKIDEIRHQAKELIRENLYREVTPDTKHNISGIYMIYIDNFTSEKIIPIYIGRSNNIQKRYKQHFCEILALNRLSYDEYNTYFFSGLSSFYEGKYKTCKIFKFMIENNCTLQNYHMIILEEVEVECLEEKEQEYFQKLLPSFFGFNQLNSLLKGLNLRFTNTKLSNLEIDSYLNVLLEDAQRIHSYYEYGFTRFNFEHSFPKDIACLLEGSDSLSNKTRLKYDEVNFMIDELIKRYIPDFEEKQREEEMLYENKIELGEVYIIARDEYTDALNLLEEDVRKKFKELNIYSDTAITNFKNSIAFKDVPKYKNFFKRYLKSKKCKLNFYEIFDNEINVVNRKLEECNNIEVLHKDASNLWEKSLKENKHKGYKLIFPSCKFHSFSLGSRTSNSLIKINEDYNLLNTCHIGIYISNNANKNSDISKEPFIIRFDYYYIDTEGNKTENKYYIDNETTKKCKSGIEYFEKYYNEWGINLRRFEISSKIRTNIRTKVSNSFISILAEFKHGINDHTIKNKKLIKLSIVLDEIIQLIDEETRFNINVSESNACLEKCMINEGLQNNSLVEKLLTNNLPKIGESIPIKKTKKVEDDKNKVAKIKRAEAYKQKVLEKSESTIRVINYVSSKEKVTAECQTCGHIWQIRSDHLLRRPYCPFCRKMTRNI